MPYERRRIAPLIRIRQEVDKRLDALRSPRSWEGSRTAATILTPAAMAAFHRGDLLQLVRAADGGLPCPKPTIRRLDPLETSALVAEAENLLAGRWDVFGYRIDVGERPAWRRHPLSHVDTPLAHFSGIPFLGAAFGDVKFLWELNRHGALLRLAQAYLLTGDERYASRAVSLIDSWIEDNPPHLGINWSAALEVAFRAIAWCWVWVLTRESGAWTNEGVGRLLWMLSTSAEYLVRFDSIHHSPNTHLTGEALGLLYVGTGFPVLRHASGWAKRGVAILQSEIPHQFLHDGFHYERATGYHRYNVEFYLHAIAIARRTGATWDAPMRDPVRRAIRCTQALELPNGQWPVLGDEDGGATAQLWSGDARDQAPLMALAATLLDDASLGPPHGDPGHGWSLPWWFGMPSNQTPGLQPNRSTALNSAGYFVGRDKRANGTWVCTVDAGPHGGGCTGHAHTDLGHVELAVGRRMIFTDPGCPVYGSDPARREWYRSIAAHGCLQVNSDPLAVGRGVFGWESESPVPDVSVNDADAVWECALRYRMGRGQSMEHRRHVVLLRGYGVLVVDAVVGEGPLDLQWNWPLGEALPSSAFATDRLHLGAGLEMTWVATHGDVSASLVESRRSPTYGQEVSASALQLRIVTSTPLACATLVHQGAPVSLRATMGQDIAVRIGDALLVRLGWGVRTTVERLPSFAPLADDVRRAEKVGV